MWKKGVALLLCGVMLLSMPVMSVCATEDAANESDTTAMDGDTEENTEETSMTDEEKAVAEENEKYQKTYDTEPDTNSIKNWPEGPKVWGETAILMEMNSGAILYGKSIEKKEYPASITKLLTALVALENSSMEDKVVGTDACYEGMDWTYASISLQPGEELRMEDALYALLFASANEVAHAIAESSAGGYDDFINKMNEKAEELGCVNSNFLNPNGLHDENHYTCAYDMALIGAAVYQNSEFRKIESDLYHDIPKTNMSEEREWITQNHKMLFEDNEHYYPLAKAGKTGFTEYSLTTLVTMAENDEFQFVCVDLRNGKALVYEDTQELFEYGFNNFQKIMIQDQEASKDIEKFQDDAAYVVIPNGASFADLKSELTMDEKSKTRGAVLSYTYKGQPVGHTNVTVTEEYVKELENMSFQAVDEKTDKKEGSNFSIWKCLLVVLVGMIFLFFVFLQAVRARKRRIARERRRRRRREEP